MFVNIHMLGLFWNSLVAIESRYVAVMVIIIYSNKQYESMKIPLENVKGEKKERKRKKG